MVDDEETMSGFQAKPRERPVSTMPFRELESNPVAMLSIKNKM